MNIIRDITIASFMLNGLNAKAEIPPINPRNKY